MMEQAAKRQTAEAANRITTNIVRVVNMTPGCVAYRVNNVGVWDAEKQVHRAGNTQRGLADIWVCVRGQFVAIEVKAGRDRQSREQQIFEQEVQRAGGTYYVARSTDEFLEWWKPWSEMARNYRKQTTEQ